MVAAPDWHVEVRFREQGLLRAEAHARLPVMPEDALRIITHPAGDELFRVVARRAAPPAAGGAVVDAAPRGADAAGAGADAAGAGAAAETVEVENRAPVRVLMYKFWAVSRVLFTVRAARSPPAAAAPALALARKAAAAGGRGVHAPIVGRAGGSVEFRLVTSVRGRARRCRAALTSTPTRGVNYRRRDDAPPPAPHPAPGPPPRRTC